MHHGEQGSMCSVSSSVGCLAHSRKDEIMAEKIKVIVIGTGNVAGIAIRCLKGREDMELVGV